MSEKKLVDRVRNKEGKRKSDIVTNSTEPKPKEREMTVEEEVRQRSLRLGSQALHLSGIAIGQLERIERDDPYREEALTEVIDWINSNA